MKTLMLLRHADASAGAPGGPDHERPLSQRGRADAAAVAHRIARLRVPPAAILTSSALRAVETARAVAGQLPGTPEPRVERELYAIGARELLERVRSLDDSCDALLVVAHNPAIGVLATELAGSGDEARLERLRAGFPAASLAVLAFAVDHWARLAAGLGQLVDLVRPA